MELEEIILSSTLLSIGDYAFNGCSKLTTISQWGGLTIIGKNAFSSSGFTTLHLPNQIGTISEDSFSTNNRTLFDNSLPRHISFCVSSIMF